MADQSLAGLPTAVQLRNELRGSLEELKKDFQALQHFVEELAPDGIPAPISLSKDDLNDLVVLAQDTQDTANDIEFEAGIIKKKLQYFIQ